LFPDPHVDGEEASPKKYVPVENNPTFEESYRYGMVTLPHTLIHEPPGLIRMGWLLVL
jgi:hypothetical protein